jgi:hypothetical protein
LPAFEPRRRIIESIDHCCLATWPINKKKPLGSVERLASRLIRLPVMVKMLVMAVVYVAMKPRAIDRRHDNWRSGRHHNRRRGQRDAIDWFDERGRRGNHDWRRRDNHARAEADAEVGAAKTNIQIKFSATHVRNGHCACKSGDAGQGE